MDKKKAREELKNLLGGLDIEEEDGDVSHDNLTITLCSYFDRHLNKPDNNPIDDECGWEEWVVAKSDKALAIIIDAVIAYMER